MADEENKVEETTEQNATVEQKATDQQDQREGTEAIDYAAELKKAQEEKDARRSGFITRQARKAAKEVAEEETEEEADSSEIIAEKVIQRLQPVIQSATQSNLIENRLQELSGGNEALKRLIQFHRENSVNPNLSINEQLDHAYAIANRKTIDKKIKELNTAYQNKSQISNIGQGNNQEYIKPGQNIVSDRQLAEIKARADSIGRGAGWNQAQKDQFVKKAIEGLATNR